VAVEIPAGGAYVLMGSAQGRTQACGARQVGRAACDCCWANGVRLTGATKMGRQVRAAPMDNF
jgi:hypothetical protein